MTKRRSFTPEFKAQVVLGVLSGTRTPAGRHYKIHTALLARWKQQLLEGAPLAFGDDARYQDQQEHTAQLERLLGRLTLEVEVSKKALGILAHGKNGR